MRVLNVLSQYIYVYEDGKVVKKPFSKEKGIITSFLMPNDIFTLTKKFPLMDEDEILMEMEEYIYSYPNVNENKEYQILYQYIKRENSIIVEALLIEVDKLERKFKTILDTFKYIDFISPAFLGWSEYYNITKVEPKNDVFIYFSEDGAFLTAFSEGKYLFHKSLNKLLSLMTATGLKKEDLIKVLEEKGLDRTLHEDDELFNKIEAFFSEFFLKVFNLINFSLNEYQISKIDRIFFYSPFKINFILEQYTNYWELNSIEFKLTELETEYNHLEYLITIFNAKNYKNDEINFSIFQRPPAFFKTPLGLFSLYTFVLLVGMGGFIGYEYYNLLKYKKEIDLLNAKYEYIKTKNKKYLSKMKKLNNKVDVKKIVSLQKEISNIQKKIDILYQKDKTPLFYNALVKITLDLKKYNLKVIKFVKNYRKYTLILKSNYDNTSDVANFMKSLLNDGFKNVNSKTIKNTKGEYISYVEFRY